VQTSSPSRSDLPGFVLGRRVGASADALFADWTEPARLRWYLNPEHRDKATVPIIVDLVVGGAWCVPMIIDDDTAYMTGGIYRLIEPAREIQFTWGARPGWPNPSDGIEVGVFLVAIDDDATELELEVRWTGADHPSDGMLSACAAGWGDTIDRLVARYGA